MSEVRTTSSTGGQKGVKPERHALIPRKATAWISRVFGFGAEKYDPHNWRKGYEWDKSIDALQRHIDEFVDGYTYDEESGLPHLAHAGFHIMVLLTWLEEQGEGADNPFDTRWPAEMERARRALELGLDPVSTLAPEDRAAELAARAEPEYAIVGIRSDTGSSSDIPAGIGDLTEDLDEPVDFGTAEVGGWVTPEDQAQSAGFAKPPPPAAGAMQIHIHTTEPAKPNAVAEMLHEAINQRGVRRENLRF